MAESLFIRLSLQLVERAVPATYPIYKYGFPKYGVVALPATVLYDPNKMSSPLTAVNIELLYNPNKPPIKKP